jgi:hypothetical protein
LKADSDLHYCRQSSVVGINAGDGFGTLPGPSSLSVGFEQALEKASGKSLKGKSSSKPKNKVKN